MSSCTDDDNLKKVSSKDLGLNLDNKICHSSENIF